MRIGRYNAGPHSIQIARRACRADRTSPRARRPPRPSWRRKSCCDSPGLLYKPGRHFLGVLGAHIDEEKLKDGRRDRFAVGGTEIGIWTDMHICTIAGSRAGKGRSAILPNLLVYPGSVLAIDPKGELAQLTADRRKGLGQEAVHVLDPFDAAKLPEFDSVFNPIAQLNPEGEADRGCRADRRRACRAGRVERPVALGRDGADAHRGDDFARGDIAAAEGGRAQPGDGL